MISIPIEQKHVVDVSICIATRNKKQPLKIVLDSIFCQKTKANYEVIVVDDGSTDDTDKMCEQFRSYGYLIRYKKLENEQYRNPGIARNVAYKMARGKTVIAQSDDVLHYSNNVIEGLATVPHMGFSVALVTNAEVNHAGKIVKKKGVYTGATYPRPLFFLGSLLREHIYAIGGNCEEFTEPGFEDDWFGQCLIHGLQLMPHFLVDVLGVHQDHSRPDLSGPYARMRILFEKKYEDASAGLVPWVGGEPWPYVE